MEVLARQALWKAGINYQHSSQHGAASLDSQDFGIHGLKVQDRSKLEPGTCISVGPACYKPQNFGLRAANVLICEKHPEFENFLCWRNLTSVPYCANLLDTGILSQTDRANVDAYNKSCLEKLNGMGCDELWLQA